MSPRPPNYRHRRNRRRPTGFFPRNPEIQGTAASAVREKQNVKLPYFNLLFWITEAVLALTMILLPHILTKFELETRPLSDQFSQMHDLLFLMHVLDFVLGSMMAMNYVIRNDKILINCLSVYVNGCFFLIGCSIVILAWFLHIIFLANTGQYELHEYEKVNLVYVLLGSWCRSSRMSLAKYYKTKVGQHQEHNEPNMDCEFCQSTESNRFPRRE